MFLGDDVIVCTRRGFKDTAVPWYNLQLEKCCTRTMWGCLLLHQSKSKSLKWYFLSFSTFLLLILRTKKHGTGLHIPFVHNTPRVPKFDVRLKHNIILMHYNVSITCIACTTSISSMHSRSLWQQRQHGVYQSVFWSCSIRAFQASEHLGKEIRTGHCWGALGYNQPYSPRGFRKSSGWAAGHNKASKLRRP